MSAVVDLAGMLASQGNGLGIMVAVVTAVRTTTTPKVVDLRVGGLAADGEDPDIFEDVPYLASYSPAVGDTVVMLTDNDEEVVLGKLA